MNISEDFSVILIAQLTIEKVKLIKLTTHYESFLKDHFKDEFEVYNRTMNNGSIESMAMILLNSTSGLDSETKEKIRIAIEILSK